MDPEVVEREKLLPAGVVDCGKGVEDVDIHGLWNAYQPSEPRIPNLVGGAWYELHVGLQDGNGIYSVIAGAEVSEIGELPVEVSLRVVPAGKYLHFTHAMKDGGFGEAFAQVFKWVDESGTKAKDFGLQFFDSDFNPEDGNSILHIYIPLA